MKGNWETACSQVSQTGRLEIAKMQQQAATAGPGAIAYGTPEAGDFTKHSLKMKIAPAPLL